MVLCCGSLSWLIHLTSFELWFLERSKPTLPRMMKTLLPGNALKKGALLFRSLAGCFPPGIRWVSFLLGVHCLLVNRTHCPLRREVGGVFGGHQSLTPAQHTQMFTYSWALFQPQEKAFLGLTSPEQQSTHGASLRPEDQAELAPKFWINFWSNGLYLCSLRKLQTKSWKWRRCLNIWVFIIPGKIIWSHEIWIKAGMSRRPYYTIPKNKHFHWVFSLPTLC